MIENNGGTTGEPRKRSAFVAVAAVGLASVLAGAGLLLGPVANAVDRQRAFEAATPCARGQTRDCLSTAPATVVGRLDNGSLRHADIEFATADGTSQVITLDYKPDERHFPADRPVRLVAWRGAVTAVQYGNGPTAGSSPTTDHPRDAHQAPLAWALGLVFAGAGALWLVTWTAAFSTRSLRNAPPGAAVPYVWLVTVAVAAPFTAMLTDGVPQSLFWTAVAAAVLLCITVALCRSQVDRGGVIEVAPRRDGREHVFPALVLGDRSGPGGTYAHSHLVVGPGVLAFTNDPTGAFRRDPLPAGLVLERVRRLLPSDPDAIVANDVGRACLVAQCRDGEREVLIAVTPRNMRWLVGALPRTDPADAD
ncbi:hypothetical protein ACFYNW_14875 [Streptomyces virginiae]|uniref:hypothetical protein n=1 Tax=Streptomyces virginiae TaxID=1961 RepID=UPI0036E57855